MVSALFLNITTRNKLITIELTFSSALFCLPFSTSPSDAMLVNVRSFGFALFYIDTELLTAWISQNDDPIAWTRFTLRDRAWQKHQGPGTKFIKIWIILSVLITSSFWLIQGSRFIYIFSIYIYTYFSILSLYLCNFIEEIELLARGTAKISSFKF